MSCEVKNFFMFMLSAVVVKRSFLRDREHTQAANDSHRQQVRVCIVRLLIVSEQTAKCENTLNQDFKCLYYTKCEQIIFRHVKLSNPILLHLSNQKLNTYMNS